MTQGSPPPLPYRRDIDGLRAFAVLSVVLYHFGLPLQGGFVGVDIFFVISGFLIGGLLWHEYYETGTLSLWRFYIRRFRRLAPAFFVMLAVTTALAWSLLMPFEFREYGKTVIASVVYLSNVLFFRGAGYFDSASEEKPLLHTWSLAVEEQFYIFLPLLMLFLARSHRMVLAAIVGTWAASLAACIWLTPISPTATFYLFPFRAWELLSGVLLAIWGYETGRDFRGHAILSWLGLGLLVVSVLAIPAGPGFPGLVAVLPVLGTVLLLANGAGDNHVNQALRHPLAVFFGLISYSLYLWHWPVYTLGSYLRGGHVNLLESLVWMGLSVGLAWLSWKCVENPVRHARGLPGGAVLAGTALASAAALATGLYLYVRDGLPERFGQEARVHISASQDFLQDWSRCYIADDLPLDGLEVCPIGPEGAPRVLVWGDSHVRAFREGLDRAAHEAGVPGIILWRAGCPPLFDIRKTESAATPAQDLDCQRANKQIKQALPRLSSLDGVLLIGRWAYYATGTGTGLDAENTIRVQPAEGAFPVGTAQDALVAAAAERTAAELGEWIPNVHVLRQPPEIAYYDSRRAAREAAHAGRWLAARPVTQTEMTLEALLPRRSAADAVWQGAASAETIRRIDPWPLLCDDTQCHALQGGVGQYFDNNHLTNAAALRMRGLFAPVFGKDAPSALGRAAGQ